MNARPSDTQHHGVLCGTDFSEAAGQAADVACALAKRLHAPLELAHVRLLTEATAPQEELSAEAERLRQRGVEVHETLLDGSADEALIARAKRKSCQLVVVGSIAKYGLDHWAHGSVSERTAERSTVPTLVVRNSAPFQAWTRGERALKICVAFNHTPTSEAALVWVKTLQALGPCEVVVGYVPSPPEQRARLGPLDSPDLVEKKPGLQAFLERELEERVAELMGSNGIRTRVEPHWDRPDAALADLAKEENADLLIVGSHQYHGFERLWKTSVSAGLLRTAAMNMAVVPLFTRQLPPAGIAPPIRKVLVTTDFSDVANCAIPHAYALLGSGGTLHLVTVIHPHELPNGEFENGPLNRDFETRHAKHIAVLKDKLRALIPAESTARDILTEVEVAEHSDPGQGICQAAERFGADVICMGTHGRAGLPGAVLGSVAQKVLGRSSRPLLLLRPPLDS